MIIKTKIFALFLILCGASGVFAQAQKKAVSVPAVSLSRVPKNANFGPYDKFKVVNLTLLGFKNAPDDWVYVFHLKDEKRGLEVGRELTKFTNTFLICTNDAIGKVLDEQKDEWLNRKINLYIEARDMGLTPYMNVGFVTKLELLDDKGKVVKTLSAAE